MLRLLGFGFRRNDRRNHVGIKAAWAKMATDGLFESSWRALESETHFVLRPFRNSKPLSRRGYSKKIILSQSKSQTLSKSKPKPNEGVSKILGACPPPKNWTLLHLTLALTLAETNLWAGPNEILTWCIHIHKVIDPNKWHAVICQCRIVSSLGYMQDNAWHQSVKPFAAKLWTDVYSLRIAPMLVILHASWSSGRNLPFETHFVFRLFRNSKLLKRGR